MRVPYSWLREYCDPGVEPGELAERLAMTGTEVERVGTVGPPSAEGFVVGRVLAAEPHPNADRLRVCTVDTGDGERTIVCGAPNVAAGQTVPVALPGATLPGGHKIGKAKLRGVESFGMICASSELELGEGPPGIMVLEDDGLVPGTPLVRGAADRRAGAGAGGDAEPGRLLRRLRRRPRGPRDQRRAARARALGRRRPGRGRGRRERLRLRRGRGPGPLPALHRPRLHRRRRSAPRRPGCRRGWQRPGSGRSTTSSTSPTTRCCSPRSRCTPSTSTRCPDGALTIRAAAEGEKMTTLDDVERTFDAETVLVCDANGPSGIAGIMGGQVSEVSEETTSVLLEVATWNGTNILRTSRMLGLRSEASSRFEKQLHPDLCLRAQRIASRLMVELCGAKLVPGTIDVAAEVPEPRRLTLRGERVEGLLGMTDRAGRPGRLPGAARLRGRGRRRGSRGHRPSRPPLRRHPRGRPDRGGRRGSTGSTSTCPARCRRWPAASAASAASSACGAAPRTRCGISASTK